MEVLTRIGHTLVDPEAIQLLAGGKPVTQYEAFCKLLTKELKARPIQIVPTPTSLPPVGERERGIYIYLYVYLYMYPCASFW